MPIHIKTLPAKLIPLTVVIVISAFIRCKKHDECYDAAMERNHSGICTTDCPGVCGCDGKFYCNECDANRAGISKVYDGPCR
jgi:hypothetical protein